MNLNRSGEDYLKTMLVLQLEKGEIRSSEIAKSLNVTRPSVCAAVHFLEESGFLTMDRSKKIRLTDLGRQTAERVHERHCVIRDALVFFGIEPEIAEQDACRIEHDLSPQTFEKLKELWKKHQEAAAT